MHVVLRQPQQWLSNLWTHSGPAACSLAVFCSSSADAGIPKRSAGTKAARDHVGQNQQRDLSTHLGARRVRNDGELFCMSGCAGVFYSFSIAARKSVVSSSLQWKFLLSSCQCRGMLFSVSSAHFLRIAGLMKCQSGISSTKDLGRCFYHSGTISVSIKIWLRFGGCIFISRYWVIKITPKSVLVSCAIRRYLTSEIFSPRIYKYRLAYMLGHAVGLSPSSPLDARLYLVH